MYKTAFRIKNLEVQLTKVTPRTFNHIIVVAPFKLSEASIHSSVNPSAQICHLLNPLSLKKIKKSSRVLLGAINKINKHFSLNQESLAVGKPVSRTSISLKSPDGTSMPVYGEICIHSSFISQGYWNKSELSSKVFEYNNGVQPNSYLTGDMGRRLPSGDIQFCGRKDSQVKIRGYRVELGEIEFILMQHEMVGRCATIVVNTVHDELSLIAFYESSKIGTAINSLENELKKHVENELPDYMMPSRIINIPKLPLTLTRKIDKLALVEMFKTLDRY